MIHWDASPGTIAITLPPHPGTHKFPDEPLKPTGEFVTIQKELTMPQSFAQMHDDYLNPPEPEPDDLDEEEDEEEPEEE